MTTPDLNEFLADRQQALLSMDEPTLRAYARKYDIHLPFDDSFWTIVHKSRTGDTTLPMFERAASKQWLFAHGSSPLDDGDVFPPVNDPFALAQYFARLTTWEAQENQEAGDE